MQHSALQDMGAHRHSFDRPLPGDDTCHLDAQSCSYLPQLSSPFRGLRLADELQGHAYCAFLAMGQEEALGRLAGNGFGSSEPACVAHCRAPASVAGSLVGSTDGDSSIDIVGLKPLKTAAFRAEQEDGALRWKSSSPRNTERRRSGSRSRFAPDFLGLHEGEETPEEHQPGSACRETTEGLQHDMNGDSSTAVGIAGTHTQQLGQGAESAAFFDGSTQQQHQQQQLEHGVQPGSAEMSDDEGAPMHEEGGAADCSVDKDWSSLVCCVCDDGGAQRAAEPLLLLMAIRSSCGAGKALHVILWMDRQAHNTATGANFVGHEWQGVPLELCSCPCMWS